VVSWWRSSSAFPEFGEHGSRVVRSKERAVEVSEVLTLHSSAVALLITTSSVRMDKSLHASAQWCFITQIQE
jgi:hypothetical protein